MATVVVLTFNAERWIGELLLALKGQTTAFRWETLIIDSGSHDGTLKAVQDQMKDWPGDIRLHQIPNREFGHGKTRNAAAELANGEYVVFLTHDAIPANAQWLEAMVRPFQISERVVCVYGKHIPWPECPPTIKRDMIATFRRLGPDFAVTMQEDSAAVTHEAERDALCFFSDVNSAIRKSILVGEIPFRDIAYAEDQRFGRDVIAAGYLKVYSPFGSVIHSHNYSLVRYFRRMYDEMAGLKAATGRNLDASLAFHIAWIGKATLDDWVFTVRDSSYAPTEKLKWLAQVPLYNIARRVAIRLAAKEHVPPWSHELFSLEARQRAAARR